MNEEIRKRRVIAAALQEPLAAVGVRIESLVDRVLDALDQNGLQITNAPRQPGTPVTVGTDPGGEPSPQYQQRMGRAIRHANGETPQRIKAPIIHDVRTALKDRE